MIEREFKNRICDKKYICRKGEEGVCIYEYIF